MSLTYAKDIRDAWRSLLSAVTTAEKTLVDNVGPTRVVQTNAKIVDPAAGTASNFALDNALDTDVVYKTVYFCPGAALTSDDTNYATLSLVYNDGAGGSDTTIATATTKTSGSGGTGSWTANVPVALAITAANAVAAAGKQVQFKIAKTGTGVVVPAGSVVAKGYNQ